MLREQIKLICTECGLTQKALAAIMGVDHQRVRNMAAGRVEKLTREEGVELIRRLNIRPDWLATGQPPMFQSEQEQRAQVVFDKVKTTTQAALALGLSHHQGRLVRDFLYFVEAGNVEEARKALAELAGLAPDEADLLENYRKSSKKGREALMATSAAFAQKKVKGNPVA